MVKAPNVVKNNNNKIDLLSQHRLSGAFGKWFSNYETNKIYKINKFFYDVIYPTQWPMAVVVDNDNITPLCFFILSNNIKNHFKDR